MGQPLVVCSSYPHVPVCPVCLHLSPVMGPLSAPSASLFCGGEVEGTPEWPGKYVTMLMLLFGLYCHNV